MNSGEDFGCQQRKRCCLSNADYSECTKEKVPKKEESSVVDEMLPEPSGLFSLPLELGVLIMQCLDMETVNSCIVADRRFIFAANRRRALIRAIHISTSHRNVEVTQMYSQTGKLHTSTVSTSSIPYTPQLDSGKCPVYSSSSVPFPCIANTNDHSVFSRLHQLYAKGVDVASLRIEWTSGSLFDQREDRGPLLKPFHSVRELEIQVSELATDDELDVLMRETEQLITCLRPKIICIEAAHVNLRFPHSLVEVLKNIKMKMMRITCRLLYIDPTDILQLSGMKLVLPPLKLSSGTVLEMIRSMIKLWFEEKTDVLSMVLEQTASEDNPALKDIVHGYINELEMASCLLKCIRRKDGERIVVTDGPCLWNWG